MELISTEPTEETQVVSDSPQEENPLSIEEYQAKIRDLEKERKELRKEAADRRTKLNKYETEEEQRRQANLSELEREKEARTSAETKLSAFQTRLDNAELKAIASRLNIVDADVAMKLIDAAKFERDEDGNITNAESLFSELLQHKPYLKSATPIVSETPIARTNPSRDNSALPFFTMEQIKDRAFYSANKDAINKALAEGRIR